MKQKLILMISIFFMITALGACQKEAETKEVVLDVANPPQSVNITETSEEPTEEPTEELTEEPTEEPTEELTEEPTVTITPVITPSTENIEYTEVDYSPILISTPPFSYYMSDTAIEKENSSIKLNMTLCEPNEITDITEWFTNNNLSLSPNQNNAENSSDGVDITSNVFWDDTYFYEIGGADYIDGNILDIYDAASNNLLYSLDFSNYIYSPDYKEEDYDFIQQKIKWATIKDDVLYVSHSHSTYAESSNNMNAYITAIDLSDMSILWRSDALVCNSKNFLIIDNVIISGYGFTAEPDFLYQINRNTGEVLEKTLLKSAPDYIIKKDSVLYVRTYNTDYKFMVQ